MRYALASLLVLGTALPAEDPGPAGIYKGEIIERDQTASGEIAIRAEGNRVVRVRYDPRTWVERDGGRIQVGQLSPGERVEIVADPGPRPNQQVARRILVLSFTAAPPPRKKKPLYRTDLYSDIFPRGDLTFSGTIVQLSGESLVLRARGQGPTRLLLRDDTRYLANGEPAAPADLAVNTRVFVRAGKNLDGDLEAYQVVWGEILRPRR